MRPDFEKLTNILENLVGGIPITDSSDTVIDPDVNPDYPNSQTISHDLDPNADGDLVVTVNVARTQSILIAAHSLDSNNWSASVRWINTDADDNLFQSESASDIALNGVSEDWARLVRKGAVIEVTFTSDVTAGTQNRLNAFVGAHK